MVDSTETCGGVRDPVFVRVLKQISKQGLLQYEFKIVDKGPQLSFHRPRLGPAKSSGIRSPTINHIVQRPEIWAFIMLAAQFVANRE